MLRRGGFEGLPPLEAEQALYLKLGGAKGGEEKPAGGKGEDIRALAEKHFAELKILLDQFACEDDPLPLAPVPQIRQPILRLRPSRARQGMGDG